MSHPKTPETPKPSNTSTRTAGPDLQADSHQGGASLRQSEDGQQEIPPSTSTGKASRSSKALLMLALCTVVFLAALDSTVVATAAPTIAQSLQAPNTGYAWIGSSYLFAQASTVPIWGRISDIFGRKPILMIANAVSFLGSVLCGFAINIGMFLAGRTIQGLGAGGMVLIVNISVSDLLSLR